jgi:hypothetical protein
MPRCDAFFEIHAFSQIENEPTYQPYLGALKRLPKVYTQKVEPALPNSEAYPLERMAQRYGPYFFTSSFSYMIALAIEKLQESGDAEKVLGFFGIDMSANEEYGLQRPGGHFFFMKACEAGIEVVCPHESDMLQPPGFYGYVELSPWWRKTRARQKEYEHYQGIAMTESRQANEKLMRTAGTCDDLQWNLNTWGALFGVDEIKRALNQPSLGAPNNGTTYQSPP